MAPVNNRINNSNHLYSPYARTPRKAYGGRSENQTPSTPGSLFKRVTQIFTPAAWFTEKQSHKKGLKLSENDLDSAVEEAEKSLIIHESKGTVEDSPNVKLANFFAQKGSQPLTDIEIEGVKSLLLQSQSTLSTPNSKRKLSRGSSDEPHAPSTPTVLRNESGKTMLQETPKFNASYNSIRDASISNMLVKPNASNSVTPFKRKVFDYSTFPSPYRSSRLKNSILYLENDENEDQNEKKKSKTEEPAIEEKKLSSTASALLSYLDKTDSNMTSSTPSSRESMKTMNYSNPYASKTKKPRKSNTQVRKPSKFEQLERSFASDPKTTPNKQITTEKGIDSADTSSMDKHKPVRSSALRESITSETHTDQSKSDNITTPSAKAFQFGATKECDLVLDEESTPSKPSLLSFSTSKEQEKQTLSTSDSGSKKTEENKLTVTNPDFSLGFKATSEESNNTSKPFTFGVPSVTESSTRGDMLLSVQDDFEKSSFISSKSTNIASKSSSSANGTTIVEPKFPFKSKFEFSFPDASPSKYSVSDVDQTKLEHFKNLFAF